MGMIRKLWLGAVLTVGLVGVVAAKSFAVFPGSSHISPIVLSDAICPVEKGWKFATMHQAPSGFFPHGKVFDACWTFSSQSDQVVLTCLVEDGKLAGGVGCFRIDKQYFLDPASVPRSAF